MTISNPTHAEATTYATEYLLHGDQSKAFRKTFPNSKANPKTINKNASEFHNKPLILGRVNDLKEAANKKVDEEALFTVADAIRELNEARVLAMDINQPSAAVSASMGKAKIKGMLVDKQEISGRLQIQQLPPLTADEIKALNAALESGY